jgi:hypothetical protein
MWNYRIVHVPNEWEDCEYGLYEVYYEDDKPYVRTAEPIDFVSDTPENLIKSLSLALEDAKRYPILENSVFTDGRNDEGP